MGTLWMQWRHAGCLHREIRCPMCFNSCLQTWPCINDISSCFLIRQTCCIKMYTAPPSLSKERCFSWYPQEWALPVLTWFSLLYMFNTLTNLLNLLSLWSLRTTGGIPQCEYLRFGGRQPALEWDEPNPIWMKLVETCMRFFSGYLGTFPYCKSSQRCGDGVLLSPNMCSVRISQVDHVHPPPLGSQLESPMK